MLKLHDPTLFKTKVFISGEWRECSTHTRFDVFNPATGKIIASVEDAGVNEVATAVDAAKSAMPNWVSVPAKQKSVILKKWATLIIENQEDLSMIMTAEQGKPLSEAAAEIKSGADTIEWFAEEAKRVYGDIIPSPVSGRKTLVTKQPVGIVAAITPWNFPMAMMARKVGPALAAGCPIILKPSEQTPLSALALAELARRAGVPAGLLAVLPSHRPEAIGREITSNPHIKKMTFTGSSRVGKILMAQCANTVKRTSMELGGNAPFIVFQDADLNEAVEGVIASKFRNAGQTCVCANRILVQSEIHEMFCLLLTKRVSDLKVGVGTQSGVSIGPLINTAAVDHANTLVEDALSKGGKVLNTGASKLPGTCFFTPTLIANGNSSMRVFSEEIFAPIAPLYKFSSEAEAIQIANDTSVGLAAYVYTSDLGRAWRVSEALECGMVGINEGVISTEVAPFGGWKESGQGREGSKYGMDDYLEIKYICMSGLKA